MRILGAPAMEDCKELDILAVTTTVATRADAAALARAIMELRLAACVQLEDGLTSFYRWQGKECEDAEVRLTVKTLPECAGALQALFAQSHPYEVPQFLAACLRASPAYHAWVRSEVVVPASPGGDPDPV
jgi:periplasmic divalent cation tolerance protein